jgi:flagellar biosynthesis GTPase FlhF
MSVDIENAIDDLLNRFVALQEWGKKGVRPDGIYHSILALDERIKLIRKKIKEGHMHESPLLDLVKEIRDGFDTKEYRAVLLDAFNWRSAQKAQTKAKKEEQKKLRQLQTPPKKNQKTSKKLKKLPSVIRHFSDPPLQRLSYQEAKRQETMKEQVMKAFLSFIEQNETRLRREYAKKEELKHAYDEKQQRAFWRNRLPGSYGART